MVPLRPTLNCSKHGGAEHCFLTCQSQVNISNGECTCVLSDRFTRFRSTSDRVALSRLSLRYVAYAGAEDSYTVTCGLPLPGSSGGGHRGDGGTLCSGKYTHASVSRLTSVGSLSQETAR